MTVIPVEAELLASEYDGLKQRATDRGMTPNDYLRHALATMELLEDQISNSNAVVLLRYPDGSVKQVDVLSRA